MKNIALIIFLFSAVTLSAIPSQSDTIQLLQNEVTKLSGQMDMYKSNSDNIMHLKAAELETHFEQLKSDFYTHLYWLLAIVPVTILALFGAVYKAYTKTKQLVEDQLIKQFQNDKNKFIALIQEYDVELTLKRQSKILVITHHEDSVAEAFVRELFLHSGCENVKFVLSDTSIDHSQFDLIFYNNSAKKLEAQNVEDVINSTPKSTMHFHFGGYVNGFDKYSNVAFSNVPSQVYGNLINQLRFQSLVKNYRS